MNSCTPQSVRNFILERYAEPLNDRNLQIDAIPDSFDLLSEGLIDSLGLLELVGAIEDEFEIDLDLQELDPEHITVVGPLSRQVAKSALHQSGDCP